jgi:hypothetical protein
MPSPEMELLKGRAWHRARDISKDSSWQPVGLREQATPFSGDSTAPPPWPTPFSGESLHHRLDLLKARQRVQQSHLSFSQHVFLQC